MQDPSLLSEFVDPILDSDPDPVVKYRLQRDVLRVPVPDFK